MRFMLCEPTWCIFIHPHHLLLMMAYDCPLAFHHKKGKYSFDSCRGDFVVRGRFLLCFVELVVTLLVNFELLICVLSRIAKGGVC